MAEIRWFNKNKSCIEIKVIQDALVKCGGLIRTRVVLKLLDTILSKGDYVFNKNKSCIEI